MPTPPDFFDRVVAAVAEIPYGRVTTYGHLARAVGSAGSARMVGWVLNGAVGTGLPCHRVVNRYGALSGARHFPSPTFMEDALRSEGVAFGDDGCVRLDQHLWTPGEPLSGEACATV